MPTRLITVGTPRRLAAIHARATGEAIALLAANFAYHSATVIVSPTLVIRVTHQGKVRGGRSTRVTYLVTVGVPNYRTRAYIKLCRQAKQRFPLRKIWLQGSAIDKKSPRGR